jgi:hypothetical protein
MKNNKFKDRQEAFVALILTIKTVYLRRQQRLQMKDNQMQGPMPSKPALIVKVTLQQVIMTNVKCQDLVLTPMCPASRTNTTMDILFMS